jgi:hypothetical protein
MSLAGWCSALTTTACAQCARAVPGFARACPHCGAPNTARGAAFAIAGALGILAVAMLVAAAVIFGGYRLPAEAVKDASRDASRGEPSAPERARAPTAAADDFSWLNAAMKACDADAEQDAEAIYFLITPLVFAPGDEPEWRRRILNLVGNAFLITTDNAMQGLKSQKLRIFSGDYTVNIRDQTGVIFTWTTSGGAARLATTRAEAVEKFNIQVLTPAKTNTAEWGNEFLRRKGVCNWVNAIVGN